MTERVEDELAFLARHVAFEGQSILDIGCGAGASTRRLVLDLGAAKAVGLEVSDDRVARNAREANPPGVSFAGGHAQDLPFGGGVFDIALMQKSLHHVPADRMDAALQEAARVLRTGTGVLIVSEPVAAGPFDRIMRIFHDESRERAAAQRALAACPAFGSKQDIVISSPVRFDSFDDFGLRMMSPDVIGRRPSASEVSQAHQAYDEHAPEGRLAMWRDFQITILRQPLELDHIPS